MLKFLRPLAALIEDVIDRIGGLTAWIALVMIGLVATNVILRYSLSYGSVWAQELEWHLLAALILLGMSHALQRGENVRVDLFYARYSPQGKRVVDVVSALLLIAVSLFMQRGLFGLGQKLWQRVRAPRAWPASRYTGPTDISSRNS
jgi:TRAP-type mannitol/chloroaromatic compound transport system permease small subunit